jgi:type IV secretory pathway VirB10-like protein
MRTSTAYFAGVGTVIVAIGLGLGGGYMAANIAHPPVQTVSKLERRMSAEPIQVTTAPAEPQQQAQPPQTQAAAPAANTPPVEEKTSNVLAAQPASTPPQPAKSIENADDKTAASRDSYARASDADLKRSAAEKRRAERRQQSADKRRWKREQAPRDQQQELDVVENSVREATEPRRIRIREEVEPRGVFGEPSRRDAFAEPARSGAPRIGLFDQDD